MQNWYTDLETGEQRKSTPTGRISTAKLPKSKRSLSQIQASIAQKSSDFWATMRTNIMLAHRSDNIDELKIDRIRNELSDILDSGILTYPHALTQLGINSEQSLSERKAAFGLSSPAISHSEDEQKFLDNMAHKADSIRKTNWSWRIGQEAEEKQLLGWHPFFVTLTIDPTEAAKHGLEPKQLWTEGREFRKYIRRLANVVCHELGHKPSHKPPYRPESDYITYAGVIEHGASREHHHGHFVIWLRAIPSSWRVCPNAGVSNPANRKFNECLPMRTLWSWSLPGLSPALYFRSIGDIWERKYNFVLPLVAKGPRAGKYMRVSIPRTAGVYITKYLSKEHKQWHHRMKSTRNLGMTKLINLIRSMDQKTAQALAWRANNSTTNHSLMVTHSVPLGLVRSLAKRQVYLLKFRARQLDLMTLTQPTYPIFSKMLQSVRNGQRPDRMHSSEFFDWLSQLLPAQEGYSEYQQTKAHQRLSKNFPLEKTKVNHVKIGANKIGYSSSL